MTQLLAADAAMVADTIRRDLFAPLVQINLGDRAPVPVIVFAVEPPEDAKSRAERLALYMQHGLTVPAAWLRNLESIPDPTDGEAVVGGKAPAKAERQPPATDIVD